jgi:hypothetical protein
MGAQHPYHGASLQVADVIKDLINFQRIPDGDFNWVRVSNTIEVECCLHCFRL